MGRITSILALTVIAAMAISLAACGDSNSSNPGESELTGSLDIVGSDTMVNLGAALAEAYMQIHGEVDVVVQGGGSGTGLAALLNENADIAQMSRAMADTEWEEAENLGIEVTEVIVAGDALVIAVHPGNPVDSLTIEELGAIYRGDITDWAEVGGNAGDILLLSRDTSSGTHVFFREAVVREGGLYPEAEFSVESLFLPSTQAIVDELIQNENAIGYIGVGYYDPEQVGLVGIEIEESDVPVSPVEDHPEGISYPLARPLYFYVAGDYGGLVEDYVEFVLGDAGQSVVREMDFLPVP